MPKKWLDWLAELKEENKVNQKGLAKLLEIHGSTVSHWESGAKPDGEQIIKLANLSGERAVDLFAMIYELPDVTPDRLSPARRRLLKLFEGRSDNYVDKMIGVIEIFWRGLGGAE